MPQRTLEEIVQGALGAQAFALCNAQAQLEAANAKIAELSKAPETHGGENGVTVPKES